MHLHFGHAPHHYTNITHHVYHHGHSAFSGIGHMITSSIVHGLIYAFIFRLAHHLPLFMLGILVVIVVGGMYYYSKYNRS